MSGAIFRWVGSKRAQAVSIVDAMPRKYGMYYEPFVGAASVFFALQPDRAVLSDINDELITTYKAIRNNVLTVQRELDKLWKSRTEKAFYKVRESEPRTGFERAARFLYLQALSFNGIWRENREGRYNVPYGQRATTAPYSPTLLRMAAHELKCAELRTSDAFKVLEEPARGDLVYVDSPYLGTFSHYHGGAGTWTREKAEQLADTLRGLARRGAHVVVSESDTPIIRKLYKGAKIESFISRQGIAARSTRRGVRPDVLITFKR